MGSTVDMEKQGQPTVVAERPINDAKNTEQDEAAMAEVGKVQQLRRGFGFWTTLGFTASMMCTWEAVFFVGSDLTLLLRAATAYRSAAIH